MARVLLLTPPEQAADLVFLLEEEGHEPCFWPVLGAPGELPLGLRAVAEHIHRLTWVIAIGRAPLRAFLEAVNRAGTRRALQKLQWLAADASTARAIERQGGTVRVPGDGKWTSAVSGLLTGDDEVLVLHEGEAPEILLDSLDAAGVGFTQVCVPPVLPERSRGATEAHQVVIVHSAAAGEAFVELTQGLPATPSATAQCCGPEVHQPVAPRVTLASGLRVVATTPAAAAALESLGVEVYATASAAAADAVVDATLKALCTE
ncbi:MAG: uroporphyrinogen-III synthase [Archangium sp.]|nr:uroporphyrinogen-III synthase [Archangium sp.]